MHRTILQIRHAIHDFVLNFRQTFSKKACSTHTAEKAKVD
jgi:hypothetical protein